MFCSRRPLRGETSAFDPKGKHVPLWSWFIAVQWLDVLWSILVLMEIEKVQNRSAVDLVSVWIFKKLDVADA